MPVKMSINPTDQPIILKIFGDKAIIRANRYFVEGDM